MTNTELELIMIEVRGMNIYEFGEWFDDIKKLDDYDMGYEDGYQAAKDDYGKQ